MNEWQGIKIIEDIRLVWRREDWSRVRSPARARRRQKQGHRQNIAIRFEPRLDVLMLPDGWLMHPEMARKLREATTKKEHQNP